MVENDWRDEKMGCDQKNGRYDLPPQYRVCLKLEECDCEDDFVQSLKRGKMVEADRAMVGVEVDTPIVVLGEDGHCVDGKGPDELNERVGTLVWWVKLEEFDFLGGF